MTYPGRWTDAPIGLDGTTPHTVRTFLQAKLDLPAGFAGDIVLPWLLWDVQGNGTIAIDGETYDAGSSDLQQRLRSSTTPIVRLSVQRSSGVALIFMINAARYRLLPENRVTVRGLHVWAVEVSEVPSSDSAAQFAMIATTPGPDPFAKPVPTVDGP
ncbi:MAG: hypothetical protein AB7N70_31970 [Dehalococcoidia bacterium]